MCPKFEPVREMALFARVPLPKRIPSTQVCDLRYKSGCMVLQELNRMHMLLLIKSAVILETSPH